jgi:DNA-binding CsgD family transcriptional regulator
VPTFRFAIIDDNILTCLGLQQVLGRFLPPFAEVVVCESFEVLQNQENLDFQHFFVSSRIYFEHVQFFRNNPHKSIVLVAGDMSINGVFTLNVCQSEATLIRDMMTLQSKGHGMRYLMEKQSGQGGQVLSAREIEVAVLLSKGYINKEIADQLQISVTTVISHRKNIMEKLGARSIADIIIYSVVNGFVSIEELKPSMD